MSADIDLSRVTPGDKLYGLYGLSRKDHGTTQGGASYYTVELRNSTGSIAGKVWSDKIGLVEEVPVGAPVRITGLVKNGYNGGPPEIELRTVEHAPEEVAGLWERLNPRCPISAESLEMRFEALRALVRRPGLKAFLRAFFRDGCPWDDFRVAPAAISNHHGYLHGLLEHTVEMAEIAVDMARRPRFRDQVDLDLLVAGCLIHDSGKVEEYAWKGQPIGMAPAGRFYNHLTMGPAQARRTWERNEAELRAAGMTDGDFHHLVHIQVSHHGKQEWGSPTEPRSVEAMIAHQADYTSAHVRSACDALEAGTQGADGWVDAGYKFKRGLYAGQPPVQASGAAPQLRRSQTGLFE